MTAQLVVTEAPAWEEAVEAYLRDCRRRNLASTTIAEYRYVLSSHARIVSWRRGNGIRSIADLTGQSLWSLEMELTDAGVSAGAVATIHRRLHSFGVWCEKRYGVGGGVRNVSPPLQRQTFPETYTDDQVDAVLRAARTARDRLIVEVLVHTGLRASELCNLVCSDVQSDRAGAWLRVRQGKGRKDRHVPLDTPATQLSQRIVEYIHNERPTTSCPALFLCGQPGADGEYSPLRTRGLQMLMRRLSDATGLHVHAHAFRHTFATRAIAAGVNPLILQRVLGHTTVEMTNRYVHMRPLDILDAWSRRSD